MITIPFVIPKFKDVFADMLGKDGLPEIAEFLLSLYDTVYHTGLAMVIPALLIMFVAFLTVAHLFGLSASHDTGSLLNRLFSRLAWLMPWRRNRIKRYFIWIFCELLDIGVAEAEAIEAAAAATKNSVVRRSEEYMSERQSRAYIVCRLLLENKNCKANIANLLLTH